MGVCAYVQTMYKVVVKYAFWRTYVKIIQFLVFFKFHYLEKQQHDRNEEYAQDDKAGTLKARVKERACNGLGG